MLIFSQTINEENMAGGNSLVRNHVSTIDIIKLTVYLYHLTETDVAPQSRFAVC
jgi:hypothetical protein